MSGMENREGTMETVTLYREIGKTLHTLGAFRVVLLNSKATPKQK